MATVLLSVSFHESGFRKDVDEGKGKFARGDHGRSWCLMQMNVGSGRTRDWNLAKSRFALATDPEEEVEKGYTGQELVEDRKKCFQAGLRLIVGTSCKSLPPSEWLRAYASGSCEKGSDESKSRMGLAIRWFDRHRPAFKDIEIIESLKPVEEPKEELNAKVEDLLLSRL
jgi:hypothetical protein